MHETDGDLARLQGLLDASYAAAGPHLLRIHTPERRLDAPQVAQARCASGTSGSGSRAARSISRASTSPSRSMGRCRFDLRDLQSQGFRQTPLDVYVPRYGPEWEQSIEEDVTS